MGSEMCIRDSINTNSYDPQTFSSEFNSDGSKFYIIGYGSKIGDNLGDDIDEFSVSPAYDLFPTLSLLHLRIMQRV